VSHLQFMTLLLSMP